MRRLSHFVRWTLLFLLVAGCRTQQYESIWVDYKPEWNEFNTTQLDSAMALQPTHSIEKVNWEEYPYTPMVDFALARTDDYLLVRYEVTEDCVYAQNVEDMSCIWQDDCVEFFCRLPNHKQYLNFETNCLGALLSCRQVDASSVGRSDLSADEIGQIVRVSSLPREPINSCDIHHWTLMIGIPYSILGINSKNVPEYLRGNFYKCGDNTSNPHFLSWSPIDLPSPQFHAPQYFGKIYLQK